jgi:hypothetical protein
MEAMMSINTPLHTDYQLDQLAVKRCAPEWAAIK